MAYMQLLRMVWHFLLQGLRNHGGPKCRTGNLGGEPEYTRGGDAGTYRHFFINIVKIGAEPSVD